MTNSFGFVNLLVENLKLFLLINNQQECLENRSVSMDHLFITSLVTDIVKVGTYFIRKACHCAFFVLLLYFG